ncbi:hypothetical protein CCP2SC5_810002 [Azospirillaceae bacterium]
MKFRKRGGRKRIIFPSDASIFEPTWSPSNKPDPTLVKALARAHRWKKLLDTKKYETIKEIAETEDVAARYIGQLLKLTLLAPDIVEMILDGRLPIGISLADFMPVWPGRWDEQKDKIRRLAEGDDNENAYND